MSTEKIRKEFERAMPIPDGVYWSGDNYMTTSHHFSCLEYRGAWKGWQACLATISFPENPS